MEYLVTHQEMRQVIKRVGTGFVLLLVEIFKETEQEIVSLFSRKSLGSIGFESSRDPIGKVIPVLELFPAFGAKVFSNRLHALLCYDGGMFFHFDEGTAA